MISAKSRTETDKDRSRDIVHDHVVYMHVLDPGAIHANDLQTAAAGIADHAIANADVAEVARRFRAQFERAPDASNHAARDHDVFRGGGAGGLDANGVIAAIEIAPDNADAPAGIDIDSIIISIRVTVNRDPLDQYVFTTEVVTDPARRIPQGHILDLYVPAVDHPQEKGPLILFIAEGGPAAVNRTLTGYRDINGVPGVNEAAIPLLSDRIGEAALYLRVIAKVGAALEHGPIFEVERDAIAQAHRANNVNSRRHSDRAATGRRACINCRLESSGLGELDAGL